MIRVVFDTNVLISARLSLTGNPARCVALAQLRRIESVISESILDEFSEKLITKFGYDNERARLAVEEIRRISELTKPEDSQRIVPDDVDDDKFVHCALAGRATHIVSGDRHLLSLKKHQNVSILRPTEFLSLIADTV